MQWRFILPCKSLVERLFTVSLAKNISKAITFLKYVWCQCSHELGKQFRTYIFHISAIESLDDPGDELSFFPADLTENSITSWDREGGFVVTHAKIGIPRLVIATICLGVFFVLAAMGTFVSLAQ
jgi:hypothetical protein